MKLLLLAALNNKVIYGSDVRKRLRRGSPTKTTMLYPFRFRKVMEMASTSDLQQKHPLYYWFQKMELLFGDWQGGPWQRWSPVGGTTTPADWFGAGETNRSEEHMQCTEYPDRKQLETT